ALAERHAVDSLHAAANRLERAGRDVARDDGIRHSGEAAVPEMDVGPTHLGAGRSQQSAPLSQLRARELPDLDALTGTGQDRGQDALAHEVYVILDANVVSNRLHGFAHRNAPRSGARPA